MISKREIAEEIAFHRRIRKDLAKKLKRKPRGNIYYKKEHGYYRPYIIRKGKETYIKASEGELIKSLTEKKELQQSIKKIDENLKLLRSIEDGFSDLTGIIPKDTRIPYVGKSRSEIAREFDRWARLQGSQNIYYEATREHIARDGTILKSKSELIIYEFLLSHDIEVYYEKRIIIDGEERFPDFTIKRKSDGAIIIWEHFGMMDRITYEADTRQKMFKYNKAGFWPFDNMICTYDFGDGKVDIRDLENIVKMMGLVE